jgi:hypothetical protein
LTTVSISLYFEAYNRTTLPPAETIVVSVNYSKNEDCERLVKGKLYHIQRELHFHLPANLQKFTFSNKTVQILIIYSV